jgi:PAS domain S-box-containing protein
MENEKIETKKLRNEIKQLKLTIDKLESEKTKKSDVKEAIIKSESKFRNMIMNMIEGFYSATLDGKLLEYNHEFARLLGLDPMKDYTGTSLPDFWQNTEDRNDYINEFMKHGYIKNYLVNGKKANGEKIIVQVNSRLIKDENEKPLRIEGTFLDITEKKSTENKLIEIETKSRIWLENSPVCTKIVDLDFNLQYMSSSGIRDLKIDDINEYYGKPYPFHFYPDSFKVPMNKNLKKAKLTGEIIIQEASVLSADGIKLWYHSTIVPVNDEKGQLDYIMVISMETTERKQAEEALQKSNSLLNSIIESPENIIMFALDTKYNYLSFNNAHAKEMKAIYGVDIEISQHVFSYMPNENDRLTAEKNYIRALKGERFSEFQEYGEAGSRFWYELIFNPINDNSNNVTGITVFVTNITERKRNEKVQQESKERLDLALNGANAGLWSWNIKTGEDLLDERWCGILGYKKEEVKQEVSSWENLIHPDDKERIFEVVNKHFEDENNAYKDEYRMKCKNGKWKWIFASGNIVERDTEGNPSRMTGIIIDIDERKKAEKNMERLSRIFEDSLNEIYLLDSDSLKFTLVNKAAQNNLGYTMEELQNMTPLDFTPEFTSESFSKLFEPLRKGEKEKIVFETVHQRKDKSLYNVEIHLQLLQYEQETLFAAFIMDITSRYKVEKELKQHREHLEGMVKERTADLEEKNKELDNALKVFVGRELTIKNLQEKIKVLEGKND